MWAMTINKQQYRAFFWKLRNNLLKIIFKHFCFNPSRRGTGHKWWLGCICKASTPGFSSKINDGGKDSPEALTRARAVICFDVEVTRTPAFLLPFHERTFETTGASKGIWVSSKFQICWDLYFPRLIMADILSKNCLILVTSSTRIWPFSRGVAVRNEISLFRFKNPGHHPRLG